MKIERVDVCRCVLGEAPVWDVADQALYLLDIGRSSILRYRPASDSVDSWQTPLPATALALCRDGAALVAMKDTVAALDLATGEVSSIATAVDQPASATLNDGKVDRQGRFVIGSCCTDFDSPHENGGIYSLGTDGVLRRAAGGVTFSNGTCFSPDGATLYFSDPALHTIYAYEYDERTGEIGDRRTLATTRAFGGMPDGATVDGDGLVWVAIMEGGKVVAFRPDGQVERVVDLPVALAASVMFGGAALDQLYVATADPTYFGRSGEDGAGYLYVIEELGARGLAEPRFGGASRSSPH
ncbi:MAG: SMP-30/gluconolactonase/LRE family protein [Novosphingobium sp.]|nr:SMP-30/gluconolactonase/LRE family protein [Novosphingobium sp.]